MVAAFLWAHISVPILFVNGAAVDADEGIVLAVAVVLDGTTADVADRVVVLRQTPGHTHRHHLRLAFCLFVDIEVLSDDEFAFWSEDVGHGEVCINAIAMVFHDDLLALVLEFGAFHTLLVPAGILPCGKLVLELCTVVIIGRSAPEAGFHTLAVFEDWCAVDIVIVDVACPFIPCDTDAVGFQGEPGLGIVNLNGSGSGGSDNFSCLREGEGLQFELSTGDDVASLEKTAVTIYF